MPLLALKFSCLDEFAINICSYIFSGYSRLVCYIIRNIVVHAPVCQEVINQKSQNELKTEPQAAKSLFKHSSINEFLINLDHKEELKSQPRKQLTKRYQERHQDLFKMKSYGKQNFFFDLIPVKARQLIMNNVECSLDRQSFTSYASPVVYHRFSTTAAFCVHEC